jgi:prepilin-type N-terminal cleavage/methylation domain-containing protein
MRICARSSALRDESGFTIIEIIVAMTILLIGVLGVTTMISVSNKTTQASNSRQGATTVVRRALETSRALPFRSIKNATLATDIQAQAPDLATTTTGSWTVSRDSYLYTVSATVCRVDDDSDGFGVHDTADPTFCTDSATTGTADDKAGDYKRVAVTASWVSQGVTKSVKQVTLVPPGGTGDAPAVTDVHPTSPTGTTGQPLLITTQPSPSQVSFSATATNGPSYMTWLIDGTPNQTCPPVITACSGSGASWAFTWPLGTPTIDNTAGSPNQGKCITPSSSSFVFDGTYQVGAQPLDSNGLAGTALSTPVTINRCAPIPPPNFNATGRDKFMGAQSQIDIEWDKNPEGDLVGYKVFRGTSSTSFSPVCPSTLAAAPIENLKSCIDPSPATYNKNSAYYYGVYAYDQDTSGATRQGALAYVEVNTAQNSAPKAPTTLTATASGGNVTVGWKIPATPFDPDTGDTIESFRVYRRAAGTPNSTAWTYLNRIDPDGYDSMTAFCGGAVTAGASCSFLDDNTGGVTHQYMVTSVDSHLRESDYITSGAPTA